MNRREVDRIPLKMFLNEYVQDRPHRAVSANISPTGLYVNRVFAAGKKHLQFGREDRYVQLEFALPGTTDTIWARGEIRYDELAAGPMVHGTGIQIKDIARGHARLLKDYVIDKKRQKLQQILELIRRNRYH
jgi:c-di-GMP-binding flagellar brake protein YcgR